MSFFNNKKILIIGGTGTIGNHMTKELLNHNPSVIRIYSRDEYKQFMMNNQFKESDKLRFLIGDVRDYDRLDRAFEDIDIVFHLAAMKHVSSCEYNPFEAVKTNVIGIQNVINAAIKNHVSNVTFTSSDKAISPTNAYGATKLLAERLISAANYSRGSSETIFSTVRFGNVMGSRGSVINIFKEQIREQNRITLTNEEMTRFMMTKSQAVNLTMKACENAIGGETFVLKMPVIKLVDLKDVVLNEVCNKYSLDKGNISQEVIGLRPGEKMYEELMTEDEFVNSFDLGDMYSIPPQFAVGDYSSQYSNVAKSKAKEISSNSVPTITYEAVKKMIVNEDLI